MRKQKQVLKPILSLCVGVTVLYLVMLYINTENDRILRVPEHFRYSPSFQIEKSIDSADFKEEVDSSKVEEEVDNNQVEEESTDDDILEDIDFTRENIDTLKGLKKKDVENIKENPSNMLYSYVRFDKNAIIPYQLWQTDRSLDVSEITAERMQTWKDLNDEDFNMNLWDDQDLKRYFEQVLSKEDAEKVNNLKIPVMRADFWRYLIVFIKGGIYADTDTVLKVPFKQWLPRKSLKKVDDVQKDKKDFQDCSVIIGLENKFHFCQWTFASVKGHPIFKSMIQTSLSRMVNIDWQNPNVVHDTLGQIALTKSIKNYFILRMSQFTGIDKEELESRYLWETASELMQYVKSDPLWSLVARSDKLCFFKANMFNGDVLQHEMMSADPNNVHSWKKELDDLMPVKHEKQFDPTDSSKEEVDVQEDNEYESEEGDRIEDGDVQEDNEYESEEGDTIEEVNEYESEEGDRIEDGDVQEDNEYESEEGNRFEDGDVQEDNEYESEEGDTIEEVDDINLN